MPKTQTKGKTMTAWGRAYYRALRKGYDHGYAAYLADLAEQRASQKGAPVR